MTKYCKEIANYMKKYCKEIASCMTKYYKTPSTKKWDVNEYFILFYFFFQFKF